jgi:hypothetical protein
MKRMVEVVSIECDECGKSPADTYSIHKDTRGEWIVDLCEKCSAPIRRWEAVGRPPKGKRRPYRVYGGKAELNVDGSGIDFKAP